RLQRVGHDQVPGSPEGIIVGQALVGAGVRFPLGHRDHLSLDEIDQAYVLHDPSFGAGEWPRTLDCRSGTARIDSERDRGHPRETSRVGEGSTRATTPSRGASTDVGAGTVE